MNNTAPSNVTIPAPLPGSMIGATFEIRNDTSWGIPHSFIVVSDAQGNSYGYGFYPAESGAPNSSGAIADNTAHEYTTSSEPIPLTLDQYSRIRDYVNSSIASPPPYAIGFGSHCAAWAMTAAVVTGVASSVIPASGMEPNSFFTDIMDTVACNPYTMTIEQIVNDFWRRAITPLGRDPLAVDLDGDGIETVAIPTDGGQPVLFDHNADGIQTGTGWVRGDDAWLAMDRDGNGSIDTGRELFGVDTEIVDPTTGLLRNATSGFEALSAQDGNGDHLLDANDAAFSEVRLWRDLNQDGQSQSNELFTLQQQGIASISLVSDGKTQNLGNGNTVTGSAKVTYANGGETEVDGVGLGGDAGNLNLSSNPFYREFTDAVPVSDAAAALPGMGGSGVLRDLQEAMSLGTEESAALLAAVQAFASADSRESQQALLDEVLMRWAATGQDLNQGLRGLTGQWNELIRSGASEAEKQGHYESLFGAKLDAMGIEWRSLYAQADFRIDSRNDAANALIAIAHDSGLLTQTCEAGLPGNLGAARTMVGEPLYIGLEGMGGVH
jgi:hypothetical protein